MNDLGATHFDTYTVKNKPNDIVRVKITTLNTKFEDRYYETLLMFHSEYAYRNGMPIYGQAFEKLPYKWWEIQKFWMRPSFRYHQWLLRKRLTRKQKINIAIPITIFSIESLSVVGISKGIIEVIKYIIH